MTLTPPHRSSNLSAEADPSADAVVSALHAQGQTAAVNALLRGLTSNQQDPPAGLPDEVRAWFDATAHLPPWTDPARLRRGEDVFLRYGVQVLQSLLYRSLFECYASAPIADVLVRAGRLTALTHQRVVETLRFTIAVMQPGGLGPTGEGIRAAQRVRLLHAAIRHHLRDHDVVGVPLSQADMQFTLGTFAQVPLEALARFGVDLTPGEQADWLHAWNVVGALMGIPDHGLFTSPEHAAAAMAARRTQTWRPTDAGRDLARALLAFCDELIPGRALDGANATMVRHLGGDALADTLDLPAADWTRHLLRPYRASVAAADAAQDAGPLTRAAAAGLSRAFLGALLAHPFFAHRPDFALPTSLRAAWGA